MFIYELLYTLELSILPINAIFYIVAVTALLLKLNSITNKLKTTIETKKSSFFAYKLIFSLILLESLLMVLFVEGFKQQVGVLIWIIYVSALMVLFLIFLALTISDSFFTYKNKNYGNFTNSSILEKSFKNFSISINLCLFILFIFTAKEIINLLYVHEIIGPILNGAYSYNYTFNDYSQYLIDSNDIFNIIKRDFSNSSSHYLLSGLLQAVCLVIVIFSLIFG